jgi:cysteinyl-tRNA synthetase
VLGLGLMDWQPRAGAEVPAEVQKLVAARTLARAEKRWADADTLRAQIAGLGYDVEDSPAGPVVKARK